MALIEQTMTEKNLEAHQRNAQQSHGAATAEGKERARAANLRHGYYSEMRDQALVALGEDPEGLAALAEGARQQFRPTNAYQEWITGRIASLQWRIQRCRASAGKQGGRAHPAGRGEAPRSRRGTARGLCRRAGLPRIPAARGGASRFLYARRMHRSLRGCDGTKSQPQHGRDPRFTVPVALPREFQHPGSARPSRRHERRGMERRRWRKRRTTSRRSRVPRLP